MSKTDASSNPPEPNGDRGGSALQTVSRVVSGLPLAVNIPLLCEALTILADDLEFIANGGADEFQWKEGSTIDPYEGWSHRESAGLQLTRLRSMLNFGQLDLAELPVNKVRVLQTIWKTIKNLRYGHHSECPDSYSGAFFFPDELNADGSVWRGDEKRDRYGKWRDSVSAMMREHYPDSNYSPLSGMETKSEKWSPVASEFRGFAEYLETGVVTDEWLGTPGDEAPQVIEGANESEIPDEFLSREYGIGKAATLFGLTRKVFNLRIESGEIRAKRINRQAIRLDKRQIPN